MIVKALLLTSNPFVDAYELSDFLGKVIFLSLIALSVLTWVILLHKGWVTLQLRRRCRQFEEVFNLNKNTPLQIDPPSSSEIGQANPFLALYTILRKHTVDILHKNRSSQAKEGTILLSPTDISLIESQLYTARRNEVNSLEKNLYILSTIVALAPFLGLLGTVWGILTTFSQMQAQTFGGTNQMVLGGLSLALATTVLGLVDAIPALIGYNYLKNVIKELDSSMEGFSNHILTAVELQYRQVDL